MTIGSGEAARRDLKEAFSADPKNNLKRYFYALASADRSGSKDPIVSESISLFLRSEDLKLLAWGHALKGMEFTRDNWEGTRCESEAALRAKPDYDFARTLRGMALYREGSFEMAIVDDVRSATTVEADGPWAYEFQTAVLFDARQWSRGFATSAIGLQRFPTAVRLWADACNSNLTTLNSAAARFAASRCAAAQPHSGAAQALIGCLFFLHRGDLDATRRTLRRVQQQVTSKDVPVDILGLMLYVAMGLQDHEAVDRYIAQILQRGEKLRMDGGWRLVFLWATTPDEKVRARKHHEIAKLLQSLPLPAEGSPAYSTCKAIEAVALAELGKWERAVACVRKAIAHHRPRDDTNDYKALLKLIEARKRYRCDPALGYRQPLFPSPFLFLGLPPVMRDAANVQRTSGVIDSDSTGRTNRALQLESGGPR